MRALVYAFIMVVAVGGGAVWAQSTSQNKNRRPAQTNPPKNKKPASASTKTSLRTNSQKPSNTTAKPATAASKDWPLLVCGKDLRESVKALDDYQKKAQASGRKLPANKRADLYLRESVYSQSLTLFAPETFWDSIIVSRRPTKRCVSLLGPLKRSMETNDSRGTPARLNAWNECVRAMYGQLPSQAQRINVCVNQGLSFIKGRQSK